MFYCMFCSSELIWQQNYDTDDFEYDFEGTVTEYLCPNECCSTSLEVIYNSTSNESIIKYHTPVK